MEILERINHRLNLIMRILGGVAVLSLMAIATINVCLRIFGVPYRGTYEMASFLGAATIGCALGYTQMKKSHIVVDIVTSSYSKKAQRILDAVSHLISSVFFGFISYEIIRWGIRIAKSGEVSETLKLPYYPFIFCVSTGFAIFSLTLFLDFLMNLWGKEKE